LRLRRECRVDKTDGIVHLSRIGRNAAYLFRSLRSRSVLLIATIVIMGFSWLARAQNAMQPAPAAGPTLSDIYQPALDQVGASLRQIDVGHWKLSRQWKAQIASDVSSIQQDLSGPLTGLLQKAQVAPAGLGPRIDVARNVDALYDVMVRVTTAANLSGGKSDAALLDNALVRLQQARKAAADGLQGAVQARDQEIVQLRATVQAAKRVEQEAAEHPKTIVVENGVSHRKKPRAKTTTHHKAAPKTGTKTAPKPSPSAPAGNASGNPQI
jgi:hypothetical protein